MKASEIIAFLAKEIEKHGDKRVLFNTDDGIWYEPVINKAGKLFEKPTPIHKDSPYLHLDLDLV